MAVLALAMVGALTLIGVDPLLAAGVAAAVADVVVIVVLGRPAPRPRALPLQVEARCIYLN